MEENVIERVQYLNGIKNMFDEFTCEIGDLTTAWTDVKLNDGRISRKLDSIKFEDKTYSVTNRFIVSVCSKFGMGPNIFNLFTPAEVFERLQAVEPRTRVRIATEGNIALAASTPSKAFIDFGTTMDVLSKTHNLPKLMNIEYKEGIITATMKMSQEWEVNGDKFVQAFTMYSPVDGYGMPNIYLSLNRVISGATFTILSKAFRSEVQLGVDVNNVSIPMNRVLESFNNEEGFMAIRQRLEAAHKSYASLHEVDRLQQVLYNSVNTSQAAAFAAVFDSYAKMTGDASRKYGIAGEKSISSKKSRLLPMNCTIADLMNFASETADKFRSLISRPQSIATWIGNVLENEYDLEGSKKETEQIRGSWFDDGANDGIKE
jgi:hypothetical protein